MLELGRRAGEPNVISDPDLPTLPAVLDPIALGAHLRQALPGHARGLEDLRVRLLRHHPGKRCVVEVTWRWGDESRSVIGKVYARDRSDVYRVMEEIRRAGFGPEGEFSIPEPMAYLPALQLFLQEKVDGRPATESFLSDDEAERTAAAERCAGWLATFHAMTLGMGPSVDLPGHLRAMEQWGQRLAGLGGPLADKAVALLTRLHAAASGLLPVALRTIHGDYAHHQVILAPGRTATVDWDKYRLADPSHEAARFAVGLQRLAQRCLGSIHALDGPAAVFLRTYVASTGPGQAARLAFYRAAVCLEHAKHDVHKQARGWPEKAAATLDEGVRVLAEGW